jgi:hypothetical protein
MRSKPKLQPRSLATSRDRMWVKIRAFRGSFSLADLMEAARVGETMGRTYLGSLTTAGFVEKTAAPGAFRQADSYRLVRDNGVEAPRFKKDGTLRTEPTLQERIWAAIKALPSFSAADVVLAMGAGSVDAVTRYLQMLQKAGYVAAIDTAKPPRYRLLPSRNSGPRAPAIRAKGTVVYDPNLARQVYPQVRS